MICCSDSFYGCTMHLYNDFHYEKDSSVTLVIESHLHNVQIYLIIFLKAVKVLNFKGLI